MKNGLSRKFFTDSTIAETVIYLNDKRKENGYSIMQVEKSS